MAVIADPDRWTFRWGPDARVMGDDYVSTCQGQREHDNRFYLYAVVSDTDPEKDPDGSIRRQRAVEGMAVIEKAKELALIYGWRKIIWVRKRKGKPDHVAEFDTGFGGFDNPDDSSHLDAGIPNIGDPMADLKDKEKAP